MSKCLLIIIQAEMSENIPSDLYPVEILISLRSLIRIFIGYILEDSQGYIVSSGGQQTDQTGQRRAGWFVFVGHIVRRYEPVHDKTYKMACVPSKNWSAWASTQSDQSLLCTQWVAKYPSFLYADSINSNQTGQMFSHT